MAPRLGSGLPEPVALSGRFWRHQAMRFTELGGSTFGGRWLPPGAGEAIYLARPIAAVTAEAYRHLVDRTAVDPTLVSPRLLFTVAVELERVLDLREASVRRAVRLTDAALAGPHEPCREVGRRAHADGYQGVVAPAATSLGEAQCVFGERIRAGALRVMARRLWELPADPRI